jgi:hypothetical protein
MFWDTLSSINHKPIGNAFCTFCHRTVLWNFYAHSFLEITVKEVSFLSSNEIPEKSDIHWTKKKYSVIIQPSRPP